ncbi:hypothetical protein OLMES_3783 [Oleiphilus messinensis]|uniref:Uncharacterized protein n=1 Tax=Oleiphilus messinensis TaxID=141451 RepID=A0A1Y0IEL6_9GAMM|nr:hypothetical protein OLMES_3783 [Oleiphilus messinensis]
MSTLAFVDHLMLKQSAVIQGRLSERVRACRVRFAVRIEYFYHSSRKDTHSSIEKRKLSRREYELGGLSEKLRDCAVSVAQS